MSSTVINVENLSKFYRLGLIGGGTLKEDVYRWYEKLRGKPDPLLAFDETGGGGSVSGQIWALRDINFNVQEGEILGLIGGNGAGKSTLLKILSKITAPTDGKVTIYGRVGSLLEVGTGFHPELTGRENIYLNGAILGMSRAEVSRKLDEIVEFSEMSKFIDTPVKRYSSGMTVRLAFAVAAHLEPEILIVDEVLAVGDAAFQKKCLGKMKDVAGHGRTVMFVSHNMGSISDLCTRCLLLENGKVELEGSTKEAIQQYLLSGVSASSSRSWEKSEAPGDSALKLLSIGVKQNNQDNTSMVLISKPVDIILKVYIENPADEIGIRLNIYNSEGKIIVQSSSVMNRKMRKLPAGEHEVTVHLPAYLLNTGKYTISISSDLPFKRYVFRDQGNISFDVIMDCELMGRYPESSWKGVTGAGICQWKLSD